MTTIYISKGSYGVTVTAGLNGYGRRSFMAGSVYDTENGNWKAEELG